MRFDPSKYFGHQPSTHYQTLKTFISSLVLSLNFSDIINSISGR